MVLMFNLINILIYLINISLMCTPVYSEYCCSTCETINISLKNAAATAHGSFSGTYIKSSMVNGKESWISSRNGIWFTPEYWIISHLDYIGTNMASIYSNFGNRCPYDLSSEHWRYYHPLNGWIDAAPNNINVECL